MKGFGKLYFEQLWLQSAMLHDYGYFRDEIKEAIQISELTKEYDLLTDLYVDSDLNCLNGMSVKLEFEHFFRIHIRKLKIIIVIKKIITAVIIQKKMKYLITVSWVVVLRLKIFAKN